MFDGLVRVYGASHAFKALMGAGVSEEKIKSGGKTLEKVIEAEQMKAYSAYLSARSYMAFVMTKIREGA